MVFYKQIIVNMSEMEDELELLLPLLQEWRRKYSMTYRRPIDRYLCAKSYMSMAELLSEHFGIKGMPDFRYNANGKPFLAESPSIHFNISHCQGGIICAASDRPVGVDIETVQFDDKLARFVLSEREYQEVISSEKPDIRFTEYWTMKESKVKLSGTGI